ncbi:uncharacterized protein LOC129229481 isoform X2 [Uloborus diversus]|uniref:uncharacterized protein LOC129229481 isoform X2 n=1 Tax=Uloborus diversus TaxID=327109 RepID=UPI00240909DB|nr:uncharacterized protein LOC129229481 isoform X2 [Uloborus diversus]
MERRNLALKHVSNALNLDSNGFYQAAFAKYLQSLQILSLYLNDLYVSLGFQKIIQEKMEVIHVLSMIHECSDRIAAITEEKGVHSQSLCPVQNQHEDPDLEADLPRTFPAYEKMQKENMSILRMYENRLEKTTDKSAKTNLKLELERRLAENRIVTKAKYDAAVKKLQKERVQMMEKEIRKLFQINSPLNEKEKEKRQIYFSVVNYAKTEMWPCSWKLNCTEYSVSEASQKVFMKIIRCPTHPLLHWMIMIQTKIKREVDHIFKQYSDYVPALIDHQLESSYKLEEFDTELMLKSSEEKNMRIPLPKLVYLKSVFENTSSEITRTIGNFLEIFYLVYKSLLPDDSEVLCYKLTEEHLLKPIWPTLIVLCRILNISSEYKIYESMSTPRCSNPSNFGIGNVTTENSAVHAECISLLKKLLGCTSLVEKLQILVQVTHKICDGNIQAENQQRRIGADELIPQLCYVILQSRLPQLTSECYALEQLFDMKFTLGEEGYALSSFITALKYIEIKKLMDFENSEEAELSA